MQGTDTEAAVGVWSDIGRTSAGLWYG